MKKIISVLLILCLILSFTACGEKKEDYNAKDEGVMTFAEFTDAELDSEVVVEGYVQLVAYNSAYGNVCIFLQDLDGGYYVYRAACDDTLAATLTQGAKIKVTGSKAEWAGEVEIANATIEVVSGNYVADPADITSVLGTDAINAYANTAVKVVGGTIVESTDANGNAAAFLYNWDGSGTPGSDIYFNVDVNGTVYTFLIESDEFAAETDVYKAAEALEVGQTVDLTGLLYWYNAPQLHVSSVTVK